MAAFVFAIFVGAVAHVHASASLEANPVPPINAGRAGAKGFSWLLNQSVTQQMATAAVRALRTPSRCVPDGYLMHSIVNEYHLPLQRLQQARMGACHCLMRRFVSLCLGHEESSGVCVRAVSTTASDYRKASYHAITFLKWHTMRLLLHQPGCRAVLFMDADIVCRPPAPAHSGCTIPLHPATCDMHTRACTNIAPLGVHTGSTPAQP